WVVVELDEEEALRVDAAVDDLGQVSGVPEAPLVQLGFIDDDLVAGGRGDAVHDSFRARIVDDALAEVQSGVLDLRPKHSLLDGEVVIAPYGFEVERFGHDCLRRRIFACRTTSRPRCALRSAERDSSLVGLDSTVGS